MSDSKHGPARVAPWPIHAVRPSARNPRTHGESQIRKIADSIRAFGWTNPILIDPSGEIIAGEARWRAAQLLGRADVPVIVLEGLSPAQREAYRIADNRLALDAGWDEALLAQVLRDLETQDFDLAVIGFDDAEIDALLAEPVAGRGDPDAVVPPPPAPVTRLGDVWELGPHRLICGDSTKPETFAALLGGRVARMAVVDAETADLVFTDPPYGMSYKGKTHGGIIGDDARGDALIALVREAIGQAVAHARKGAALYCCFTWRTYGEFERALAATGLAVAACIVWDKGWIGPGTLHYRPQHEFIFYCRGERWYGGHGESDVWRFARDPAGTYVHPTQKPVALIERAIENSSRAGDVVLDVFGGSGSTLIACERTRRIARLVELDPKYCDAIVRRWEQFTGRTALRRPAA